MTTINLTIQQQDIFNALKYTFVTAVEMDFDCTKGEGETWRVIQPNDTRNAEYHPIHNYYLSLGTQDADEICNAFHGSCFTTIEFTDGTVGLSLISGGMPMEWDIARAFIKAGYFPPTNNCQLQAMSGEDDALVIAACIASLQLVISQALRAIEGNQRILAD